jgi:hypothetical protein
MYSFVATVTYLAYRCARLVSARPSLDEASQWVPRTWERDVEHEWSERFGDGRSPVPTASSGSPRLLQPPRHVRGELGRLVGVSRRSA